MNTIKGRLPSGMKEGNGLESLASNDEHNEHNVNLRLVEKAAGQAEADCQEVECLVSCPRKKKQDHQKSLVSARHQQKKKQES